MDAQMRSERSHYDLLGVQPTATGKQIREAYRRLLKQTHPDSGGSAALLDLVSEAYGVLIDPDERRLYDERNGFADAAAPDVDDAPDDVLDVEEPIAEPTTLDEPTTVQEPAGDELEPAPDRPRWLLPVTAALAVLLVAGVVAAGVTAAEVRDEAAARRAGTQALAAAGAHAQAILSYDHRTLDADFARAMGVVTGAFRSEYEQTTSAVVRPTATQYKAVVKAEVSAAGVVRASRDRVVVLLFVDQTTTSTRLDKAKLDRSRVRMTLERVGGRWLVSEVDAL